MERLPGPVLARSLVGREVELGFLRGAWADGGVRVLRGPAGMGKTRLVRELVAWTSGQGAATLVGRATGARSAPLRPIAEALNAAARTGVRPGPGLAPFVPALAALVPDWRTDGGRAPESTLVLGEAVLRLLVSLAEPGTATLVVEDVHWADPETLAVVEYLADHVEGAPVLLVLTYRDGEAGDGLDLVADLVRRRVATVLGVEPLDDSAVVELAHTCLDGRELPPEAVDALIARSEGIPFLVEELVATAVGAGWDTIAAAVPGSVVTSVEVRLDAVTAVDRTLLVAAALLGRAFDWSVAARTAGVDESVAGEVLRQGVRTQLLEVEGSGFRFRHALTRDAVLAATPPAELALLAGGALAVLEESGTVRDGPTALLAAELADRAGRPEQAAALLVQAARHAVAAGALVSADRFATRAAELAPGDEVDDTLLQIAVLAGQTDRATALGERLLAARTAPLDQADLHLRLGAAHLAAGRDARADDHAVAAIGLADSDRAVTARADALAALAAMARDDTEFAATRAGRALDGARAVGLAEVQCEALEVLGRIERGRDLAAAEAAFQEAHDVAAAAGLTLWRVRALQELGTVDLYGSLELSRLTEARREAVALGAVATTAVIDIQLAAVYNELGRIDEALTAARRSEEASRRWELGTLPMSLVIQGISHARTGDRAAMEAVVAAARATRADTDYVEAGVAGNVHPIFHLVDGDLAAAVAEFDRAMAVLRRRPALTLPFPGLWALVRTLLDDDGDRARAEVAAMPFDTPTSRATLHAADAVTAGRAGDAEAAVARFRDAESATIRRSGGFRYPLMQLLVAPAAHADGWGDPVGWLRGALAAFEAMGLDALAARCRSALRDLGAAVPRRTKAAVTESVPPVLAGLGITAREVDVLVLAAGGATNREIAERLFISPRTVDKHVERLLLKTGTSRRGLAALARDAGLLRT